MAFLCIPIILQNNSEAWKLISIGYTATTHDIHRARGYKTKLTSWYYNIWKPGAVNIIPPVIIIYSVMIKY